MDLTFNCTNCKQELVVDSTGAGSEIVCPACNATITVPTPSAVNIHPLNPIASSAAAKEIHHYTVPVHDAPTEILIKKPNPPLEVAAKSTDRKLKIRTIRRTDCVEVGHDRFDERVSEFLANLGEENIVNVSTVNYTHMDMATRQLMTDFGIMVIYKG